MEPFEPVQQNIRRELELELVVTTRSHDRLLVVGSPHGDLDDVGTYELSEIVEAHRFVDTGRKKGNVVVRVAASA